MSNGRLQQLKRLDPERHSDPFDVVERDVPGLALDVADEGAMEADLEGKGFLRPFWLTPQPDDVQRENLARRGCRIPICPRVPRLLPGGGSPTIAG